MITSNKNNTRTELCILVKHNFYRKKRYNCAWNDKKKLQKNDTVFRNKHTKKKMKVYESMRKSKQYFQKAQKVTKIDKALQNVTHNFNSKTPSVN